MCSNKGCRFVDIASWFKTYPAHLGPVKQDRTQIQIQDTAGLLINLKQTFPQDQQEQSKHIISHSPLPNHPPLLKPRNGKKCCQVCLFCLGWHITRTWNIHRQEVPIKNWGIHITNSCLVFIQMLTWLSTIRLWKTGLFCTRLTALCLRH